MGLMTMRYHHPCLGSLSEANLCVLVTEIETGSSPDNATQRTSGRFDVSSFYRSAAVVISAT